MDTWVILLLFSIGAVLLFVVGMSLTLIVKGHHIDSEIATNKNMQDRGISCAVQDAWNETGADCPDDKLCGDHNCSSCAPGKLI